MTAASPDSISAKLARVPNSPKTPHLTIRAPRELQDAAKAKAAAEGTTVTSVVLAALSAYVSGEPPAASGGSLQNS